MPFSNIHSLLADADIHNPKGFSFAGVNTYAYKNLNGGLEWRDQPYQGAVESFITYSQLLALGNVAENTRYILTSVGTTVDTTVVDVDTTALLDVIAEIHYSDAAGNCE